MKKKSLSRINIPKVTPEMLKRFLLNISFQENCWMWIGRRNLGYGIFITDNGPFPTHRVSFSWFNGQLIPGKVIHHKCENPECVNPIHLVQLSYSEHKLEHIR